MLPKGEIIKFNPSRWYCYIQRNAIGAPLYVGKGRGPRAFVGNANHQHGRLRERLSELCPDGYLVELIYADSEQAALDLERQLIETLRPILNCRGVLTKLGTYVRQDIGISTLHTIGAPDGFI